MERFSVDQLREFEDAFLMFCKYDKQGTGHILSIELRDMLKIIGYNPTDETLETLTIVIVQTGTAVLNSANLWT